MNDNDDPPPLGGLNPRQPHDNPPDNEDAVVQFGATCGIKNAGLVTLKRSLIGLNGNRDRAKSDGGLQVRLAAGGHVGEAVNSRHGPRDEAGVTSSVSVVCVRGGARGE